MIIKLELQDLKQYKDIYVVLNQVPINLLEKILIFIAKKLGSDKIKEWKGVAKIAGIKLPDPEEALHRAFGGLRKSGYFNFTTRGLRFSFKMTRTPQSSKVKYRVVDGEVVDK